MQRTKQSIRMIEMIQQQLNEAHMKNTHTVTLKITVTDEHLWNHHCHWNWTEFLDLNPQLGESVEVVSRSHQCDKCGVMVPEDEYTGHDKPDGTSEYLCPDCPSDYGNGEADADSATLPAVVCADCGLPVYDDERDRQHDDCWPGVMCNPSDHGNE